MDILSSDLANKIRHLIPERFRPIGYLKELTRRRTDCSVFKGPFAGMRYIQFAHGSPYIPKLLGIYERELLPQVEALIARRPRLVIDIGAAEGYYAVGLALRLPEARIIAFEMEPRSRKMLLDMAILNNVKDRIVVRGQCKLPDLTAALGDGIQAVVICDVEGYEGVLLDPTMVPALRNAAILVELHDFVIPEIAEVLNQRFAGSHLVTCILQEPRRRSEFPFQTLGTFLLPGSYLDWAVSELRCWRQAWLWMMPKNEPTI